MARPRIDVDTEQLKQLAMLQCSHEEMATVLKVSPDTLQRRYAAVIKEGRENGKMSLKRMQFKKAMEGNIPMLIWLGKNLLGQRDRQPDEVPIIINSNPVSSTANPLDAKQLVTLYLETKKQLQLSPNGGDTCEKKSKRS